MSLVDQDRGDFTDFMDFTQALLYTEGVAPYSPGFASLGELPWVTGHRVPVTPKGLRPYVGYLRLQIIWA